MTNFSLIKFVVFVVCAVQFAGSHEIKIPKCLKTPDTWKKVEKAIKECQEDVKLKIFKDTFHSNHHGWDESFFDHDDIHSPWDLQEEHPSIIDHHSLIHDHHPPIHAEHPSNLDHHPSINDHHPSIHNDHHHILNNHPSIHDHHPSIHDDHPSFHDHHPPIHHHQHSVQNHYSSTHDHHTGKNEHLPSLHNHETAVHYQHQPLHPTNSPHDHPLKQHHPYDAHQIEAPQLQIPHPFVQAIHKGTQRDMHPPREYIEHVAHTDSLSDDLVEHNQHIDFNDFRKKRDANDHGWTVHPATVSYHDKRIAGCIMQCIYEKNDAVDHHGWPTLDGLVNFYTEGVNEQGYFMATLRAVDYCLKGSSAKYHVNRRSTPENGQTCDVAFDVFDCVSDRITEYCSDHHSDVSYIKF